MLYGSYHFELQLTSQQHLVKEGDRVAQLILERVQIYHFYSNEICSANCFVLSRYTLQRWRSSRTWRNLLEEPADLAVQDDRALFHIASRSSHVSQVTCLNTTRAVVKSLGLFIELLRHQQKLYSKCH